jgi:hypothetical protein
VLLILGVPVALVVIGTDFEYCFHNDSIEFLNSALIETDGQPMKSKIKKEVICPSATSDWFNVCYNNMPIECKG